MCSLQEAWPPPPFIRLPPTLPVKLLPPPASLPTNVLDAVPYVYRPPPIPNACRVAVGEKSDEEEDERVAVKVDMTVMIVVGFTVLWLTMLLGFSIWGARMEKRMDQMLYMLMTIKSRS